MTPSTKDTLEPVATGERSATLSTPSAAGPDTARLRADAVSLDVQVKVHGSRVTDVVLGTTPHTEPFEEETSTMIIFPQGGVLRMATAVNVGQMLVLTNQKTKQDAICRVVKVRAYSKGQAYVEVEFTHRQTGFWGVRFSGDDEDLAVPSNAAAPQPPAVNPPAVNVTGRPIAPVVPSVSAKVQEMKSVPSPVLPASAFAQIGSHEDVQPAASSTSSRAAMPREIAAPPSFERLPQAPPLPLQPRAIDAGPAIQSTSAAIPNFARAAETSTVSVSDAPVEQPRPSRSFGTLTGGGAVAAPSTAEMGTRLGASIGSVPSTTAPSGGKGLTIAACAAFLLAGLAIGAWYFRQHPASSAPVSQTQPPASTGVTGAKTNADANPGANANPNAAPQPSALETQNLSPSGASRPSTWASEPAAPVAPSAGPSSQRLARNSSDSAQVTPREIPEAAPREQKTAPMGNIGMAVIGAHPVAKRDTRKVAAAPDIAPAASASGIAIPGAITAGTPNLPPPPSLQRVRVGGLLVPAKVLHSTPPVYPPSARVAGMEGNVVISADIDETGKVTGMKVVSGLAALRQPALDALKNWKYQPATLNGDAVASQATVTIQFRK